MGESLSNEFIGSNERHGSTEPNSGYATREQNTRMEYILNVTNSSYDKGMKFGQAKELFCRQLLTLDGSWRAVGCELAYSWNVYL